MTDLGQPVPLNCLVKWRRRRMSVKVAGGWGTEGIPHWQSHMQSEGRGCLRRGRTCISLPVGGRGQVGPGPTPVSGPLCCVCLCLDLRCNNDTRTLSRRSPKCFMYRAHLIFTAIKERTEHLASERLSNLPEVAQLAKAEIEPKPWSGWLPSFSLL